MQLSFHAWEIDSEETYKLLTNEPEDTSERIFFERGDFVYTTPYTERSTKINY